MAVNLQSRTSTEPLFTAAMHHRQQQLCRRSPCCDTLVLHRPLAAMLRCLWWPTLMLALFRCRSASGMSGYSGAADQAAATLFIASTPVSLQMRQKGSVADRDARQHRG
jgi:hypothetical protein